MQEKMQQRSKCTVLF